MNSAQTTYYQRLHAITLATGAEKTGAPVTITGTYPTRRPRHGKFRSASASAASRSGFRQWRRVRRFRLSGRCGSLVRLDDGLSVQWYFVHTDRRVQRGAECPGEGPASG